MLKRRRDKYGKIKTVLNLNIRTLSFLKNIRHREHLILTLKISIFMFFVLVYSRIHLFKNLSILLQCVISKK